MNKFSHYPKSVQLAIILGAGLIIFGIISLFNRLFDFSGIQLLARMVNDATSFIWPLALIGAGVFLIWAGKQGKFKNLQSIDWSKALRKSHSDKRIAGVCGGIASYLGVDSTIIRVLVVILFVVLPGFTILAYILAAIFLP